ncbi:SMP-30/gluconolactonase/LRE family protein [Streptomyces ferrugineus]|uniref:SMP-30/gluconolactonase/LRE family protein n=1 Tax=Streptomyces ferrugineus TaxID=1413221 RepID=A0A7M2SBC3_9ACTN|nr:RHS repeat-associated core domain-containing protein [Streptomyces ferrugineus]QOV33309.1 SMP-30/gluconolactonase/LRE family protein [Streptomyces ferrugineus]
MSYQLSGRIEALLGPDCREAPPRTTVRFFTPRPGATTAFTVLSKAQAQARKPRWLADAEIDHDGRFTVDLRADGRPYEGGPLEVGLQVTGTKQGRGKPRTVDCALLAVTPDWRPGNVEGVQVCDWQYALPAPAWAQIRQHLGAYVLVGLLSTRDGIAPLTGVRVAAFDADLAQDDPLGQGHTDADGWFRIDYPADAMRRTPLPGASREDGSADVYFTADHNGRRLLDEPRTAGRHRDRRNVGPVFCTRLRSDAAPLTLSIDTPKPGKITNQPRLTVTGHAGEPCRLTLNDEPVTVDANNQFTTQVSLTEGDNALVLTGTATGTGARVRRSLSVILDTTAPAPPDLALVSAHLDDVGHASLQGTTAAVEPAAAIEATNIRTGNHAEAEADAEGAFTLTIPATTGDTLTLTARDSAGNTSNPVQLTLSGTLPPDPAHVAPPLPTTTITPLAEATAFLYTGPNPIQTGTGPDTFQPHRVAVLRGRVTTPTGNALPGATVTIHDHPEYGQTRTRADGHFDLAVNGGTQLTLNYTKDGHHRAQRPVTVPWQDYLAVPDVVLTRADPAVTTITLTATSPAQLVRASTVTDHDGTRRATLFIPAGTTATMRLPDGTSQPLEQAHIRITEYTVGDSGLAAMPADLPPASAYTYAVECTADEAVAAGADTVRFSRPVVLYVENFLGFPVGGTVPLGSYDHTASRWQAEPDGRVLAVLSITSGTADLDLTGEGRPAGPDALAALGISDEERAHLAAYPPGRQLWRVPLEHFSPEDCNWTAQPEDPKATPPDQKVPAKTASTQPACHMSGSIIDVDNQILQEHRPLACTGLSLCYCSDRAEGFSENHRLRIPLTSEQPPSSLRRIELDIACEGRTLHHTYAPEPSLAHTFVWDGKDAAGRRTQGARPVTITIGYVYRAVYTTPANFERSFGLIAGASRPGGASSRPRPLTDSARQEITLRQRYTTTIGAWTTPREAGLGGWSLNLHHTYDPVAQTLYLGDGRQRQAEPFSPVITTIAGTGQAGDDGDAGPATKARVQGIIRGMAVAADGTLYFSDTWNNRVRKITPDGTITTFAGAPGPPQALGDGGPATAARVGQPTGLAIAHDNTLYIVSDRRLRKVAPDGTITTVAVLEGITSQPLHGLALGPDGSLYVAETGRRIFRVTPDGDLTVYAGDGDAFRDNVPATETKLDPFDMVIAPDSSLYVADYRQARIRRITPDGTITTFAGTHPGIHGDGGPATQAQLSAVGLALHPDGTLYITDRDHASIRAITPDGTITTIAGTGHRGTEGDGQRAISAQLRDPEHIALAPDGTLYISDALTHRIRKIASPYPGFTAGEMAIPSEDGHEIHILDSRRHHTRTINAYTGATITAFHYDDHDRLTGITHGNPAEDNTVTITRNPDGHPTAITGPDGQRTQLTLNTDGYLAQIADPAGARTAFSYHPGGLLATLTNPLGHKHSYTYETDARLHSDTNPSGTTTLAAKRTLDGHTVTALTTEGRESAFTEERLPTRATRRTVHCCGEHATVTTSAADGSRTTTTADGTVHTVKTGSDPRWGTQAPLMTESSTTTPAGLRRTTTIEQTADLADPTNPLSLIRLTRRATTDGRAYTTTYDAATRTWTYTPPNGPATTVTTDDTGRLIRAQTGALAPLGVTYDNRGRLATLTRGAGTTARTWTCHYSAAGDLAQITNPLGQTTELARDVVGRPTTITAPDDNSLRIGHDTVGNVVALTPAGHPPHTFAYDGAGNLTAYKPPPIPAGAEPTLYTYDADHLLTGITRPGNRNTVLLYDAAGRLEQISNGSQSTKWTYIDGTRRPATITSSGGSILTRTFDGPLLTGEAWQGPVTGTVRFTYDNRFLRASQQIGTESPILLTRDADGRITNVGDLQIHTDPETGLRTAISLGTVTETWTHNSFGEPIEHRVKHRNTEIYAVTYDRDQLGRITEKHETVDGNTEHALYTYDERGRLASTTIDGTTTSYTYDSNGNRTAVRTNGATLTATYNDQDQLMTLGSQTLNYGPDGELEKKTDPLLGATSFRYDNFMNLITVDLPNGSEIQYVLDAADRPVTRIVDSNHSRTYLYDNFRRPIAELGTDGQINTEFVFDTLDSAPAYLRKSGQIYRIVTDHLGSPRLVINTATGKVAQRLDYGPWGDVVHDTQPGFQPFGFAGGHYDPGTELIRYGVRYYDPPSGRWTTKDPMGIVGESVNRYLYCANNPVNRIDPNGTLDKAIGIEIDFSAVAPWFSGGGGKFGVNLQWVIGKWIDVYWVTPTDKPSSGFSIGLSCEVNFASGQGDWKGIAESRGGNVGPFSGSQFNGVYNPASYEVPWAGISLGVSGGPSLGFYETETSYNPWFGNK